MITAGKPQEFIPQGREYLAVHPGEVYLPVDNTLATPAARIQDVTRDLLKALRGVSLKDQEQKEHWFLKEGDNEDLEEEFYFRGKTVVWSKTSGLNERSVIKSFTMEGSVQQVLWADFNIRSCKPRTVETVIEVEDIRESILSGICVIENSNMSVFSKTGEDFVMDLPFQVLRAWPCKYGILFERDVVDGNPGNLMSIFSGTLPVIFSLMHPLDDIAPVMKRWPGFGGIVQIDYFGDSCDEIIFCSSDPPLILTYSKKGCHTVWKLRTTTFEEADFAGSKIAKDTLNESHAHTSHPVSNASKGTHSRYSSLHHTPGSESSPLRSYHSSRVSSPGFQNRTSSPSVSGLTHMATLSRSHSPSVNSSVSRHQNFTPLSSMSHRSSVSPLHNNNTCEFMDSLSPDICFDFIWAEQGSACSSEAASKAFLSTDTTGHNFMCYLLKSQHILKMVKFEESNDTNHWIFGTMCSITAVDAEALPDLNLIIIVDMNCTLSLYTGLTKVSKVHMSDLFGPFRELPGLVSNHPPSSCNTPRRQSLVTSTRPPSASSTKFGDESQILSPVAMNVEEPSTSSFFSEELSFLNIGSVVGLRDAVRNRVNVETKCGNYRLELPDIAMSKIVKLCLEALRHVLPRDVYTHVFVRWYSSRNAPGPTDVTCEAELNAFLVCLLNGIGFNAENIILGNFLKWDSSSPSVTKKQKTSGCSDENWYYVFATNMHSTLWRNQNFYPQEIHNSAIPFSHTSDTFNTNAVLFPYMAYVLFAVHLVYEECKLNVTLWDGLHQLCSFLCELSRELRQFQYLDHYWRDFPDHFTHINKNYLLSTDELRNIHYPNYFAPAPSIFNWIYTQLSHGKLFPFPYIPHVTKMLRNVALIYSVLTNEQVIQKVEDCISRIITPGTRLQPDVEDCIVSSSYTISSNPKKAAVLLLTKLGITKKDIDTWPIGIALALKDAILHCWHEPSGLWSKDVFDLIGRTDLSSLQSTKQDKTCYLQKAKFDMNKNSVTKEGDDGFNNLDHEVLRLRFSQDHRLHDVFHMLQSSKPMRIALQQRPEVSDHEFIEEQERHLYSLCIRTMAATVGRGMFTLRTYSPVVTETLPIPKLCLTGRAPPRNTTVDLSHIDVPANMNMWPLFHNGVSAGLSICPDASKIDSTWIVYNKPRSSSNDTPTEHAGFLMGLGLNGHLSSLSTLSIHDYLCKGHELTSVGVLLGVSAAKRGTMDLNTTKMLSIHIEALLPPTSTELDVPPTVQVAAVMGLGLLYQGSCHHHIAEVLLGEIGRPPGPEMEHCVDRESYSLAAGLALGLVTFGKGKEMCGVAELPMADQLYHYMVGGHKRPLTGVHKEKHKSPSYQIREGDNVNVDVTSPGATLALGMMFFDTDNRSIAEWMTAPDTQFLLDMVRPDFLLLRTLSKGLILWPSILPTVGWVESHIPEIVSKFAFKRGVINADVDYETMSQAYCNIIAGCCFCMGLKFAGSANQEAFETLMKYAKYFLSLTRKPVGDQAGRSTIETCLNVTVLSLALVMTGTGDLDVIRICRYLRSRVSQAASYVLYGSHMVTHMALGLLFLGGGRFSLSTTPLAIGALICAFFPKFPQHSNDNRYHLQAFYHLYVLAVEPRLIIPRMIDSNKPVYVNVKVKFKDTPFYTNAEYTVKAPCMLPELKFLKQVIVEDSRYWPIVFHSDENWGVLCNLLKNGGTLHVMQNAGCLPYSEDPQGFRSLVAQSYIWNNIHAWNIKNVQISKFSSDPVALNFASYFLKPSSQVQQEKEWQQEMCGFLFECASLEKMEAFPICMAVIQMAKEMECRFQTFDLWQVKMVCAYEKWTKRYCARYADTLALLRPDFSSSISSEVERKTKESVKDLKEHLHHYLTQNWISSGSALHHYASPLAGFLILHDVPHLQSQNIRLSEADFNVPSLLSQFSSVNFSTSSVMSVISVLSS